MPHQSTCAAVDDEMLAAPALARVEAIVRGFVAPGKLVAPHIETWAPLLVICDDEGSTSKSVDHRPAGRKPFLHPYRSFSGTAEDEDFLEKN